MTSTRKIARSSARRWWGLGLGACAALAPLAAPAAVTDVFYERTVMTAAHARCGLFTPAIASALEAGRVQARGAALRSGVEASALALLEGRAKAKAGVTPCNSPDLTTAADRARSAFEAYSRRQRETYDGDVGDWTAQRTLGARTATWGLSQPVSFGPDKLIFGMAIQDGAATMLAVTTFEDGAQPYTARLVMRDERRTARPFLDRRRADARGRLPLAARIAPVGYTKSFTIDAKGPADPALAPAGEKQATAFRFPQAAAVAMANLDPREAVQVDFVFQGRHGDLVRTAYVEVGDFAAGRAFAFAQR